MELISRWISEYNQCAELPQMLGFSYVNSLSMPFAISVCTECFETPCHNRVWLITVHVQHMSDRQLVHLKYTNFVTGWPQSPVPNFMFI